MADIFTKRKRSEIMALISGKETKPEIIVRRALFKNGFRYRKNVALLPGKPDIVLKKYQTVIFVHGCFWHGHTCKRGARPSSNIDFWNSKIQSNLKRDKNVMKQLKKLGWSILTVWDCELKSQVKFEKTLTKLVTKLAAKLPTHEASTFTRRTKPTHKS